MGGVYLRLLIERLERFQAVVCFSGGVFEVFLFLALFICVQIVKFCKLVDYADSAFCVLAPPSHPQNIQGA